MVIRFHVLTQLVGNDFFFYFLFFDRISNDEQIETVGRIVSLISREDGHMMNEKRGFKCKDAALVDIIMTNDAIIDGFSGRITKHHRRFRHNKLLITRDEFTGIDARQKESIFGKSFDNINCPSVVNVCFRCCTLGQTFNDNFSLTRRRKTLSTIVSKVIPPCTLSKVRLMMMCFIYKFIQSHYFVKLNVAEDAVHRYIGESIFFHDRLIDLFVNEVGGSNKVWYNG